MTNFLRNFVKDERGLDTIDCALFVGLVAVAGIAVFSSTGISLKGMWASRIEHLAHFNTAAN